MKERNPVVWLTIIVILLVIAFFAGSGVVINGVAQSLLKAFEL
jgi:hypothetical protein